VCVKADRPSIGISWVESIVGYFANMIEGCKRENGGWTKFFVDDWGFSSIVSVLVCFQTNLEDVGMWGVRITDEWSLWDRDAIHFVREFFTEAHS